MEPANFDGTNSIFGPPKGMTEGEVQSIFARIIVEPESNVPVIVTCWKPTKEELTEILRTGRVWLGVFSASLPPVYVSGFEPKYLEPE